MFKNVLIFLNLLILLVACSTTSNSGNKTENSISENTREIKSESEQSRGKDLFLRYCMACHQSDGSGVPGLFPPLTHSAMVNEENPDKFIDIMLHGLKGPLEADGKQYNQQMPAQNYLTDEEIAEIINYVNSHFSNQGKKVSAQDITFRRK